MHRGYEYNRTYQKVPAIILTGKWLKKFGFDIQDNIEVETTNNQIIITKKSGCMGEQ